MIIGIFCS